MVKELPKLDKVFFKDARKKDEAAVLLLMRKTGIRVGSERDTLAEKKAYGATTLTSKHVKINDDTVMLSFVGKKGVKIRQKIQDKELADALRPRAAKGGKLFDTSDSRVRDYLHANDGKFHPKDLRTIKALEISLETIHKLSDPKNAKEFAKARNAVGDAVAKALGNTRTVALNSYIPPEVFSKWKFQGAKKSHGLLSLKSVTVAVSELEAWADSIHYQLADGSWDDAQPEEWWDTPETREDDDE
jgi:DNA topoisomerase-1